MSRNAAHMTTPLLVRDLMTVGVQTCPVGTPIVEVARALLERELECLVVLDDQGHGAGVISRDELVQAYPREDWHTLRVEDIMRPEMPQVPPDIPLAAAAQIMQDMGVRVLFCGHHAGGIEYPAAYISYTHFIRHLAAEDGADLRDLGIRAERESPIDTFKRRRDAARRRASSSDQE